MGTLNVQAVSKLEEYLSKIKKAYRTGGIFLVLKGGFKKSFEMNKAYWFERDLSLPIPKFNAKIPLEVNIQAKDETFEWLKKEDRVWMLDPQEIKVALEQGHFLSNIKYKGQIIGSIKVGFGKVFILDFKKNIYFPDKVAFHTDVYVVPEYRGLGVTPYLMTEVMRFLKDKGFVKIRCHIPPWNVASIKSHTKIGFKKIRYIRFFRIFGLRILTSDPARYKG